MTEKVLTMLDCAETRTITVQEFRRKVYDPNFWEVSEWHGHDSRSIPKTATIRRKLPDEVRNLPAAHVTVVESLKLRDGRLVKLYKAKSPDWKTYLDTHLTYLIVNTAKYHYAIGTADMDKYKGLVDMCVKNYVQAAGENFVHYPHCVTEEDFNNWYAVPEVAAQLPPRTELWHDINTLMIQDVSSSFANGEKRLSAHYFAEYLLRYEGVPYGKNVHEEYQDKFRIIPFPRTELKNIQLLTRAFAVNNLYFNPVTQWLLRDGYMWWYVECDNGDMYLNDLSHGMGGQFGYVPVSRRPKPREKKV